MTVVIGPDRDSETAAHPPDAARATDRINIKAGWPPRILGDTDVRSAGSVSSSRHFTLHDQRLSLNVALAHPDVPDLLLGRWEVLGCNLVCERGISR